MNFNQLLMFGSFKYVFIIFVVISVLIIVFSLLIILNPKIRAKMMSKQIKATKYMVEDNKEDIKSISDNLADATKDAVEVTAKSVKKGMSEEKNFCKYCGAEIDKDSKFCSKCGKEL